jgi:hypothetical protein
MKYATKSNKTKKVVEDILTESVATAVADYLAENPPVGGLTIDQIKSDTQIDSAIDNTHASGSDNQDLSGKSDVGHVHDYEPVNSNIQAHVTSAHAPANAQKNSDITKSEIEAVLTGELTSHSHPAGVGADQWTIIKLAGDFTTSLIANTNVTNFFFTPAPNKTYLIFGYFLLRTATATVGARPGVAWPSNITDSIMRMEAANSLTASGLQLFGARTTKNAASTRLATTADSHWGSLDGIMITLGTVSGNFQITLATETAGTNVIMKAGSILMYREL